MAQDAQRNSISPMYMKDPAPRLLAAKADEICIKPTNTAKTANVTR
jgi:hypothetical protein